MTALAGLSFDGYLDTRRKRVEDALARVLPRPPACPPALHDALRYSLDAGGKRLRPLLTLMSAEAIDPAAVTQAEAAACAIELVHTYSLIHDDLPAMDNDSLRRGRPTSHIVFGEGLAILAGDGLLTEAFALLARAPAGDGPELSRRRLDTIAVVAEAAGATGMVGGQAIDLLAVHGPGMDAAALSDMHARKTGALIRAAAVAGAIMAGGRPAQIAVIDAYAADLGLAFQIVDDILDVEGEAGHLGKTAGKDAAAGKPTYPSLHGLEESRRRALDARDRAVASLTRAGLADEAPLAALARWVVARTR